MQTRLAGFLSGTPDGEEAAAILGRCVHCGFCTATCPTYQLLGDELDSPRGRLYLIKQVVEGHLPTARTQLHLDRCLGCRACETTCPSGVEYGRLLDIGRRLVSEQVKRPAPERLAAHRPPGRPPRPAVPAGDAAWPGRARRAAFRAEGAGAAAPGGGRLAVTTAHAQGAAAGRLRAAVHAAEHQRGDRAGARCARHRDARARRRRLLRCHPPPSRRP